MAGHQTNNDCAQKSGADIFAFDKLRRSRNKSADEAGNQTRLSRYAIGNESRQHRRKQRECGHADREHVLHEPRALRRVRRTFVVQKMKMKRIRQRQRDQNAAAGNERNDVGNACQ